MIKKKFVSQPSAIASYDWIDVANGSGIFVFYAGHTVDLKLLSNQEFYSDDVYLQGNGGSNGTYVKGLDVDFDVLLNRTIRTEGRVVVNVPAFVEAYGSGSGSSDGAVYVIVTFRKWDGSTETDIVTNTSSVHTTTGATTATHYNMFAVDLNIPNTLFKKGEYLRLSVEVWGKVGGTFASYVRLGNDPKNRSATWDVTSAVPSQLTFQLPVALEL